MHMYSHIVLQAVLIDMEESVIGELVKGQLGEVFDHQQLITDVSGCGNNWYGYDYHYYMLNFDVALIQTLWLCAKMNTLDIFPYQSCQSREKTSINCVSHMIKF